MLFHQNSSISSPNRYPFQQSRSSYFAGSSIPSYHEQPHYPIPSSVPSLYQSYPYQPAGPGNMPPFPLSYAPVFVSNSEYPRTVSPNGLTLILIAILFLVALDLVVVRPQKGY
jgi:hypothetical protein